MCNSSGKAVLGRTGLLSHSNWLGCPDEAVLHTSGFPGDRKAPNDSCALDSSSNLAELVGYRSASMGAATASCYPSFSSCSQTTPGQCRTPALTAAGSMHQGGTPGQQQALPLFPHLRGCPRRLELHPECASPQRRPTTCTGSAAGQLQGTTHFAICRQGDKIKGTDSFAWLEN
jgi:hypothetical protein